ncbi:AraC family transcriptional regulator [Actinocatenispora comari]|jgi:AraC-like DNA-binding protein|uniref:AraC family transcriptional regulator n=1 Tax=Actinocatenispora comari TaxID=2807577 RepID=A0A8J4AA49_9ACTN|nr:AraC family transcriptional regulator [Actinocatenispora comari]GIL26509.1 AraC family transcriptional regulator [Actinocatenispora comari]
MGTDALPVHRLAVPDPELLPFAIGSFDEIGPLSRARFAHRHRFHEIVFVTGGHGEHLVDFVPHPVRPPQLCVLVPGQVHAWAATGLTGQVVLFGDEFLRDAPGDRAALQWLGHRPGPTPTGADADRLATVLAELTGEYRQRAAGHVDILRALLHVLIRRALRLPGHSPAAPVLGPRATLAREFARLLAGPDPLLGPVAGYAHRLGVSPSGLAEAVRQATGAPPGTWIRRARVLEARRLLAGTDLTVAAVAARVGIADAAYFCRFFRRQTGQSPGGYRRQVRAPGRDPAGPAPRAGGKHHDHGEQSIDRVPPRP